ncbi:carbohydrate-binding family 9-like protein [Terriglobus albidus]|uniref:carbohydrate-binding family 9-like protein n=1 Tax=Terriglobus albidus TaxID=1592106 RepID=UPI0021E02D93|nr:carbohydrate-binding family 9-like protein [Terriglobus albidus]
MSRILQVLETQRIPPQHLQARQCHSAMHIQFTVEADEKQAGRIGWLVRRTHAVEAVHWMAISDAEHERRLWHRTALAAWSGEEIDVDLDPCSGWWQSAPSALLLTDNSGLRVEGHDTEVRMRWTDNNLYLLFNSGYEHLNLRTDDAVLTQPTPNLWEHDVAELFLGRDPKASQGYGEYEVSPRGEWLDLDITADDGAIHSSVALNSGFLAAAELRESQSRWLAFLRVPVPLLAERGTRDLRLNLFRSQGPAPVELAWQPTHDVSFHVPSRFGYLHLLRD